MILLARYNHAAEAEEAAMLLKSYGIPTHVSSRGVKSLKYIVHSDVDTSLWILIERQLEDATELLKNPNHVVTTGLSQDELLELSATAESSVFNSLNKAIMVGLGIIVVAVLIIVLLSANK